jgi:hypothetical protein
MSLLWLLYQTIEFSDVGIHLWTLRHKQQYLNLNDVPKIEISSVIWSLFGVVWQSSEVLAHFLFNYEIADKRILKVSCETGLTSLMLSHRLTNNTTADYHPETEIFFAGKHFAQQRKKIPFVRTRWVMKMAV